MQAGKMATDSVDGHIWPLDIYDQIAVVAAAVLHQARWGGGRCQVAVGVIENYLAFDAADNPMRQGPWGIYSCFAWHISHLLR